MASIDGRNYPFWFFVAVFCFVVVFVVILFCFVLSTLLVVKEKSVP